MGAANGASVLYNINGGNWDFTQTWNDNANGTVGTRVYDNGETVGCPLFGGAPTCAPPFVQWTTGGGVAAEPPTMAGIYGGSLTVDDLTGEVTGGSLVVSGLIADQVVVNGNSWWLRIWEDLSIDFDTGLSSAASVSCFQTASPPIGCDDGITESQLFAFNLLGGFETKGECFIGGVIPATACVAPVDGLARFAAQFDANTGILRLFVEGRSAGLNPGGSDISYDFTIGFLSRQA